MGISVWPKGAVTILSERAIQGLTSDRWQRERVSATFRLGAAIAAQSYYADATQYDLRTARE
jgi:hypothetical protein